MSDSLREKYGEALIAMLGREGPLSDLTPVLERLDVLTGVQLEQKQLTGGLPEKEGVHPDVEHGSGEDTSPVVSLQPDGPRTPEPLPVAHEAAAPESDLAEVAEPSASPHEATQQAPVSASAGSGPTAGYSVPTPPPAVPSPIPHRKRGEPKFCQDCGRQLTNPNALRCKTCSNKARTGQPRVFNRGTPRSPRDAETARPAPQEPVTPPESVETPTAPAPGLAAIKANPPVEPKPTKFVCGCPKHWREKVPGWHEDVPNEGHHEDCPLYRPGGHSWPLPNAGADGDAPFTIACRWCGETREVDRRGIPWAVSEANPANKGKVNA